MIFKVELFQWHKYLEFFFKIRYFRERADRFKLVGLSRFHNKVLGLFFYIIAWSFVNSSVLILLIFEGIFLL